MLFGRRQLNRDQLTCVTYAITRGQHTVTLVEAIKYANGGACVSVSMQEVA